MNAKTIGTTLFAALLLLVTSCGQQHTAEGLVSDFIETNALHPEKMIEREFQRLDSTRFVNDSAISVMQAKENDLFKSDISYEVATAGQMLYYLRVKYVYEGDTIRNTFYLDEQLEHVVSFK